MLEDAELQLVGFFNELYDTFISERRSSYNRKEDKKKVVNICYLIAVIRNRLVNNYLLEIRLYLVASGASCDAIDAMHKAGIIVCYKTIENYRKKVVAAHSENIQKYFAEKCNSVPSYLFCEEPIYTLLRL
ncbi:10348_t:CDS:2 [Racocetra persica]|uniref:10348_t:CDS:1 n=1 Tax=Racocetra persica TaxID=160502 RepID=A0ACA9KDG7_9GLOM|nr:10348_t:CDS:2 [Racocetra persica]